MHSYSIDNNERVTILSFFGVASVYIKNSINDFLVTNFGSIVAPLTALFIFSILFSIYNFVVWKWVARISFLKTTPNLSGIYKGVLKSSYDEYKVEHPAVVTVKQSWTKMLVTLQTEKSKSCSKTGSILLNTKCDPILLYFYQNDPNIDSAKSMEIHYGTCEHTFVKADNTFDAIYYSGRGRNTTGTIKLKKVKKS